MPSWSLLDPDQGAGGDLLGQPLRIQQPDDSGTDQGAALAQTYQAVTDYLAKQRAQSAEMGLWDDQSGMPTAKGLLDAAQQYGNALLMGTTAPETVRLFHGTSPEGFADIHSTGRINGPAFFTPNKAAAADYAGGGPVMEVNVPKSALKVDMDLPGGQLLTVDDANAYSGRDGWTIDDYLNAGHNVGVDEHVPVSTNK